MKPRHAAGALVVALALAAIPAGAQEPKPVDCNAPAHRQFDFWLGAWDVTDSTGKRIGRNTITRILKGCVLREQWTDTTNSSGESLNGYDEATKRWHQTWMDDNGNVWKIDGGLVSGRMVMSRVAPGPKNPAIMVQHRWTWSKQDANHVRQLYEVSRDTGRTWSIGFDGRYARRK